MVILLRKVVITMIDKSTRLHVKELKKRFSQKKIITVSDFNEFYVEVFGRINKGTVSWYIHELKNKNIIRNISRGQYVLVDSKYIGHSELIVITMDIIKSSDMDYIEFNNSLTMKVDELNSIINKEYGYNRNYYISQGDEIQIVCNFDENIGNLFMLTLSYLHPFKVRYGMGIGNIGGELKKNSWEMNGPIFWNARDQLMKLKSANDYEGLIISDNSQIDQVCNNILPIIDEMIKKVTDKQWEAVKAELSNISIKETISKLEISKTSYYDRLRSSNLGEIIKAFKAIIDIIKIRRKLN